MMSPLQATSAGYNPMVGAGAPPPYGHPYGPVHHQAPPMHGLPPNHVAAMHAAHQQAQQQQQNPHMMSVQNGPVILVSNLNEDVSLRMRKHSFLILVFSNEKIEKSFSFFIFSTILSYYNFFLKNSFYSFSSLFSLFFSSGRLDDHSRVFIHTIRYVFIFSFFSHFI